MATLICQNCGNQTDTTLLRLNAGQKYCSVECKNASSRTNKTAKREYLDCLECSARFLVPTAWARNGRRKFCSKKCCQAAQRKKRGSSSARWGKKHSQETKEQLSRTRIAMGLTGEKSSAWKGGLFTARGYREILISTLPEEHQAIAKQMVGAKHYVLEHRLMMAIHIGRPLEKNEVVHHTNGDKMDNRIENLSLKTWSLHAKEPRAIERQFAALEMENRLLRSWLAIFLTSGWHALSMSEST